MKILNVFILLGTVASVAGCVNAKQDNIEAGVTAYNISHDRAIVPPDELFYCPEAVSIAKRKISTLTELDVAKVLFKSVQNNKACNKSMKLLKQYLEEAQKDLSN